MATYSYTDARHFQFNRFEIERRSNVVVNTSRFDGSIDHKVLPGSRWVVNISYPALRIKSAQAAEREAFWSKIGGPENFVELWHPVRPVPRGTMRNSPKIIGPIARGATTLVIDAEVGETLLPADMIETAGMLFQVVTGGTANGSGVLSVGVAPYARAAIANDSAVAWDKPTADFMPTGNIRIPYAPGWQLPFSVELVEVWS